jgi:RNA polymerase sigma-70 factor (ECF subfamily)
MIERNVRMTRQDVPSPAEAERLAERLYRFCLALVRHEADAREAAQESLLRAWRRRASRRPGTSWWTWAAGFAVNVCREIRRADRRGELAPPPVAQAMAAAHPVEALVKEERLRELHRAVRRLPPRQREVVALRYFEECSIAQAAEILGCPVGTVKSNLHKALANLKLALRSGEPYRERTRSTF